MNGGPPAFDQLRKKLLVSVALGFLVALGLVLYGDLQSATRAFRAFDWAYLPAILALTSFNYLLRFFKWQYYLRLIGASNLTRTDSGLVFLSGLSMVLTPGRVGEWLKSYLLRRLTGTPISTSAPIVIAERLTDGLAMLLLAMTGIFLFNVGWEILVIMAAGGVVVVVISQYRPLARRVFSLGRSIPIVQRYVQHVRQFYDSSQKLLEPKPLALAVSLGFVSWAAEGVAFYLVLRGLQGAAAGWPLVDEPVLLLAAIFVMALATLAGALFLLPGGLGVAEGGITALTQVLLAAPRDIAVVGTLIIRLCTLWFGVALGLAALVLCLRRLGPTSNEEETVMTSLGR